VIREPVRSSAIRTIGYDVREQVLEIEFANGRVYQYFGVPEFLYRGLCLAASKGEYFNQSISERFRSEEIR